MSTDWKERVQADADPRVADDRDLQAYRTANLATLRGVVQGVHQDKNSAVSGSGAHIVFNISSAHVADFCRDGYRNAYDLGTASDTRKQVDQAIERATSLAPESIYFGAVELSGAGIGYYGDVCLVLGEVSFGRRSKPLHVLDRNSYDLTRAPASEEIADRERTQGMSFVDAAAEQLQGWQGHWRSDLSDMVASKVQASLPVSKRRWTTGQIASAVLDDEDYLEVLYPRSFDTTSLAEVRLTAAETAAEADIANREARGEACAYHEQKWRQQRRDARAALAKAKVRVRVVTTLGRSRGG